MRKKQARPPGKGAFRARKESLRDKWPVRAYNFPEVRPLNSVGKNIKTLRLRRGLTQDDLAKLLFVSRQTVSNYETGKSHPDLETLVQIAEKLDTDANALLYGPPVTPDRRRERRKFWVLLAVSAALGLCWLVLEPKARGLAEYRYLMLPLLLLDMLLQPAFFFSLGWTAMQAAGVFLSAKRPKLKNRALWHGIVLAVLALYGVLIAPYCFDAVREWVRSAPLLAADAGFVSSDGTALPPLWASVCGSATAFVMRCPYVFFFFGAAIWGTEREGREGRGKKSCAPQTQL